MADIRMQIPAEHIDWFRHQVRGEMSATANEWPDTADIDRSEAIDGQEKITRYIDLLDQLGWDDDGVAKEVKVCLAFARELIDREVRGLGEDMLVATGHYDDDDLNPPEIETVAARSSWLARTTEALGAETVTV